MDFKNRDEKKRAKLEAFYGHIQLTEQEEKDALLEMKIQKYFHEKSKPYWDELEGNKKGTTT